MPAKGSSNRRKVNISGAKLASIDAKVQAKCEPFNQQYFVLQSPIAEQNTQLYLHLPYVKFTPSDVPNTTKHAGIKTKSPNFINQLTVGISSIETILSSPRSLPKTPRSSPLARNDNPEVVDSADESELYIMPKVIKPPNLNSPQSEESTSEVQVRAPVVKVTRKQSYPPDKDSKMKLPPLKPGSSNRTNGLPASNNTPAAPSELVKPLVATTNGSVLPSTAEEERDKVLLGDVLAAAAAKRAEAGNGNNLAPPNSVCGDSPQLERKINSNGKIGNLYRPRAIGRITEVPKINKKIPQTTYGSNKPSSNQQHSVIPLPRSINPLTVNRKSKRQEVLTAPHRSVLADFDEQFKRLTDLYMETYRLLAK